MLASELSVADLGRDITLSIGRTTVGGTIERIATRLGMIAVTIDGTKFNLDPEKDVTVRGPSARETILTEANIDLRHLAMDRPRQFV